MRRDGRIVVLGSRAENERGEKYDETMVLDLNGMFVG